jgi:hypothetical protein
MLFSLLENRDPAILGVQIDSFIQLEIVIKLVWNPLGEAMVQKVGGSRICILYESCIDLRLELAPWRIDIN